MILLWKVLICGAIATSAAMAAWSLCRLWVATEPKEREDFTVRAVGFAILAVQNLYILEATP